MNQVAQLWADRLREELPPEIEISVSERGIVSTQGRGALKGSSSFGWLPVFLRLPLPRRVLLQMFFENALDDLKSRMTTYSGEPWPEPSATPRVSVGRHEVSLAFVDSAGRVVHELRPVPIGAAR
jgi:hypothetical protein